MAYFEGVADIGSTEAEQLFTVASLGFIPGSLYLSVEDQNIRFWYGGRAPLANEGHTVFVGGAITFGDPNDITNLKIIAATGTAKVNFTVKGR
jgi:hypothetical protein